MTSINLNLALNVAEDAARRAGELLLTMQKGPLNIEFKDVVSIVTEADRVSEALIAGALRQAFPDHHIVGEESVESAGVPPADALRWYVDPLDGTTNFARGIPHFCVSIGLADAEDQPLVGVVYDPVRDECFTARRAMGAALNGKPLHVSPTDSLANAVVVSGFPYDRRTNPDNNTSEWAAFVPRTMATRRSGAAALDLCYVAAGRFDGMWEMRIKPWDVMAGLLMVTEAGGRVSNYDDGPEGVGHGVQVVASNGIIHPAMLALIRQVRG